MSTEQDWTDEPEDLQYSLAIELVHPKRATVALTLTWAKEQTDDLLRKASHDITEHALTISHNLAALDGAQ